MRRIKAVIIVSFIIIGCSPMLYIPKSTDAKEQQQLLTGRKLYVKHCSGCHNLYLPKQFTVEVWKDNLDTMQTRAKINSEEKELILRFLLKPITN
jgi:hypothetical protein